MIRARYEPMDLAPDGTLRSDALNLILRPEGKLLRLVDPTSGKVVPTLEEAGEQAEEATERAEKAETEVARLQAELERLRRRRP